MSTDTLAFVRDGQAQSVSDKGQTFDLDALWPAIPGGVWPEGFAVSREQIYDASGRLTGGPQDSASGDG